MRTLREILDKMICVYSAYKMSSEEYNDFLDEYISEIRGLVAEEKDTKINIPRTDNWGYDSHEKISIFNHGNNDCREETLRRMGE